VSDAENSEPEIRSYIKEKGLENDLLLLGYRSDIPEILSIMDIFCLTSFKEGMPLSLIEAMAAGLPVIGTDVEGIRDVIVQDRNGFLIDLDDISGMKNILFGCSKTTL
jgi:glycosyltransferase involved in cell wall biosynthesis